MANRNDDAGSGQQGGGPGAADMSNAGGSSGTGGYGSSQDSVNQQDQQPNEGAQGGLAGSDRRQSTGTPSGQSRGEAFDEAQGGGRGADDVSPDAEELEFAEDQRDHQQRGQADAEFNAESE